MYKRVGSAHVIIVIVLVMTLVVLLGLVFWQRTSENKSNKPIVTLEGSNVTLDKGDEADATEVLSPPVDKPQKRLDDAYAIYLKDVSMHRGDSGVQKLKDEGYVSSEYTIENNSGEPLLCGQEAYPDDIRVKVTSETSLTASLEATKVYNDGSLPSASMRVDMTISDTNDWHILKTTCVTN